MENLGTNVRALSTGKIEDGVDLFDILSDSWSFWDTTNKSFKDGDVTIQCKGNLKYNFPKKFNVSLHRKIHVIMYQLCNFYTEAN